MSSEKPKFTGEFEIWGSDGCVNCEDGRITLFVSNKQCISCDPKSYEKNATTSELTRLREQNRVLKNALGKLAIYSDCGCVPCRNQCLSHEALKIERDERIETAKEVLTLVAEMESKK